jgi:tetratricopeptide (TPR) repeat protein
MSFLAIIRIMIALLGIGILSHCSTLRAPENKVVLQQNAIVSTPGQKPSVHKRNQPFQLKSFPALIEAPGYVSVLLVKDESSEPQKLEINMRQLQNWRGDVFNQKLNNTVNDVVSKINDIQYQLALQKPQEALASLENLQAKHPQITSLNFLKATCLVLLGQTNKAKAILLTALAEFPDNAAGKQLLEQLGERRPAMDQKKSKPGAKP